MQIDIRAFDTLFFRDGKPFSQGEEVWANGLFPPPPSVLYGALRTAYFSRNLGELPNAGEDGKDPTEVLSIQSMFLQLDGTAYVPCPYDVVAKKGTEKLEGKKKEVELLQLHDFSNVASSLPTQYALVPPTGVAPSLSLGGRNYIPVQAFEAYLAQGTKPQGIRETKDFVAKEPKIGLTRSAQTGSAEEGKLYRVELFRPKPGVGILLDWQVPAEAAFSLPDKGFFNVGGEAKSVWYQYAQTEVTIAAPTWAVDETESDELIFKLVFCTPTFFEQGWLPKGFDPITRRGNWRGLKVEIVAAALDRPIHLGGFDMKKNKPKPMRRAVSAGSVYYLKVSSKDINAAIKALHGQRLSEFGMDCQGFGLGYLGKVNSIDQTAKNK
jgi:CRISPR-associated protein Cmr3